MSPLPPLDTNSDPNGANDQAPTNESGPFDNNAPEGSANDVNTDVPPNETQHTEVADSAATTETSTADEVPVTYATNNDGIAGVVVNQVATEDDDEPTGRVIGAAIVSETGEISSLATPLNNRDIIDPSADNRHPNPVPRPPLHTYLDESPDKPKDDDLQKASDYEVAAIDLQEHGNTTFSEHAEKAREGSTSSV